MKGAWLVISIMWIESVNYIVFLRFVFLHGTTMGMECCEQIAVDVNSENISIDFFFSTHLIARELNSNNDSKARIQSKVLPIQLSTSSPLNAKKKLRLRHTTINLSSHTSPLRTFFPRSASCMKKHNSVYSYA